FGGAHLFDFAQHDGRVGANLVERSSRRSSFVPPFGRTVIGVDVVAVAFTEREDELGVLLAGRVENGGGGGCGRGRGGLGGHGRWAFRASCRNERGQDDHFGGFHEEECRMPRMSEHGAIRLATPSDVPAFVRLINSAYRVE